MFAVGFAAAVAEAVAVSASGSAWAQEGVGAHGAQAPKARTVMNVVNFVRGCEPRDPKTDLVRPIAEEIALNTKYHLPNTILLQYDAMIRPDLMKTVKSAEPERTEYGVWIEMARSLVEKVGIPWRGRKGWDWDWYINPGFLMAYTHDERAKIIDEIFREFKSHFGRWPKSVGSWLLDAWSMDYMQRTYDVKGFCICREQDNTDAYGLRGGYFNGLYYPSRRNMLSAAVDMRNAVKAPVFKMLTPDPIYNYAKSVTPKGVESCPCTLEPVWYSGFTPSVVDWYFRVYTGPGMLNLSYMQTGQENSFGWGMIGKGLPYQIEVIARLAKEGRLDVERMCDTAERFIREHPENCPQTQVALEDWAGDRRSVWYNSKHYRANLFLSGGILSFRDVHKMCDGFEEPFLDKVCTGWQALYFTPPVLDEYLFKTEGRFRPVAFPGRFTEIAVETPDAETLVATAKGEGVADVRVTFTPGRIAVKGVPEAVGRGIRPGVHELEFDGFKYRIGYARTGDETVVDLSLPEAVTNGYCSVTAGGKALDVFMLPRPNKDFSYQRESDLNPYGAVFFESEGETEVAGTFADGKRFSFRAHPPFTRVVENGGRHGALVVCANRPERDVPDRNDPKVKWFGPGRHRPGEIRLTSGETLYLEAGAVVEAPVIAEGKDISVRGRGILSGIPWAWRKGPSGWCWTFRGERISIRDVTFAGAWNWAVVLERTKDVTVDGVRILGGKALNDDGIDVCRSENVTIRNAFIRSQDDCIAPKWWCRNLLVEDCTLWTDYANIVRLGWECDPQGGPFENLVFRNLKVCHLAMEKRPASHAWFNSAFCLQASNGQTIRDVTFDRVDFTSVEPGDIQFVAYTGPCGPFAGGGRIDQVHLRKFTVPSGAAPMITRYAAHAPGEIGMVTLESVAGRKVPELVNDDGPTEAVEVANMPDARPGLEVSAEIVFDAVPKDGITFLGNEAWSLMYQPWHGQGSFAFQVGSQWYNTALAEQPIETGKVYRVTGSWDGAVIRVAVEGGKDGRQIRRDPLPPVREPTVMWPFAGTVKAYSAKVVRKPIVHLFDLKSKDLLPRAGRPFTLTGEAFSGGTPVADAVLVAEVKTPGASVTPARIPLGKRFAGTVPCEWTVEAGTNGEVAVDFRIEAGGRTLCAETKDIVVMPAEDPDFSAAKWNPPERPTRTFYVDALAGDDARDGLSPQTAWKTLGRVHGRILGPGERLLLRRGSVFNEELEIGACGRADNWASVGAYGTGARPTIRRDRMFDQRCLLVTNAAYFAVRDLVVCNAGKGLCIENQPGVGGHVLVENCLAHHIEGSYRWNAHGIPEWRDLSAPKAGGVGAIALTGMRHLVFRDCETYQNSWGFNVTGDDLWIGRIYTHDNASPNTSPHPMITATKRAWYVDSVLDASGWNASAGTMGIMLCVNRGFVLRGVHFLNMPDSASWDEGGVDFESGGEGILVDRCTFRRNAGAAIEVLGLYTPQARNLHFRECRFDRNNWANNLGPSEIYIHGAQEKSIDCSCGLIERCGYVLEPGIAFYTNKSCHSSKAWILKDNREWPTAEQLDRAMPWGDPPTVSAGSEIWTSARTVRLSGSANAGDRKVDVAWETREGPGEVRFAEPRQAVTAATFPCEGDWRVALKADDGRLWRSARTAVHVLPEGSVTMRAWSFAKNHDLEGWTHWNLGTTREVFKGKSAFWDTFANPVHDVVGDCYVVALKSAKGAYLLSPDDLYLSKDGLDRVRIRMQNRTNAAKMRLRYLTTVDMDWDDAKSVVFDVTPEDRDERVYEIPLALRGHLKRLRLDFAADEASVTGTVRIDYVWAGRR